LDNLKIWPQELENWCADNTFGSICLLPLSAFELIHAGAGAKKFRESDIGCVGQKAAITKWGEKKRSQLQEIVF